MPMITKEYWNSSPYVTTAILPPPFRNDLRGPGLQQRGGPPDAGKMCAFAHGVGGLTATVRRCRLHYNISPLSPTTPPWKNFRGGALVFAGGDEYSKRRANQGFQSPAPAGPAALASRSPWLQEIAPPEKAKKNRWGVRLFVGASLLIGLICLGVGIWYVDQYGWAAPGGAPDSDDHGPRPPEEYDEDYYHWDSELSDEAITIPSYPTGGDVRLSLTSSADRPALTPQEIYDRVTPSAVTVLGRQTGSYGSVGTGVIFSSDGYILTNCHVIAGCRSCSVLITGSYGVDAEYDARVVGYDVEMDLAVLKVPPGELMTVGALPFASFGDSEQLVVGDPVYAIGAPRRLRGTLTNGIISAIDRDIEVEGRTMTLLQTNAALNSGNSGGPLISERGQVVGINVAKYMSDWNRDSVEGLGFAIPSAYLERIVNDLLKWGEVKPEPRLGILVITDERGLLVDSVEPGTAAEAAGVLAGDYITAAQGEEIQNTQDLFRVRRTLYVGDELTLTLRRQDETLKVTLVLEEAAA